MTASYRIQLDPHRPLVTSAGLQASSPLLTAVSVYAEALAQEGASQNTVSAFEADLRLFAESAGADTPVGKVKPEHVEQFREFLTAERDVPCSPATLRRRLTAVQSLFRFLEEERVVASNPVQSTAPGPVSRRPASTSLLSEAEVEALQEAARAEAADGDWRPLLLVSLLLSTGMSKTECLGLNAEDLDLEADTITIGKPPRSRTLPLPAEVREAYLGYRKSHPSGGRLFDCTGRNLEYVLASVGRRAGLGRNPSFRILRTTAAARLLRQGEDRRSVVDRLGISPHTWPAMRRRISE
jgi:integrase/recombinase XerD